MEIVFCMPLAPRREVTLEEGWLPAARRGEPWALERLYAAYQPQVYALCHRMLGRTEDAEDAMQTTFVRAFRELHRFRGDSALKTWIYRIAVNESIGLLRKRRDSDVLEEETADVADTAPEVVRKVEIQVALSRLSPDYQAILILRFWEGLSCEEIARVLGISVPAAKMRLYRAREEFRRRYEGDR